MIELLILLYIVLVSFALYVYKKLELFKVVITYKDGNSKKLAMELEDYKQRYKDLLRDRYLMECEHKKEIEKIYLNQRGNYGK